VSKAETSDLERPDPKNLRSSKWYLAIPGEVAGTATAKADAVLAASSNNTTAVATLDTPFANAPPTLADMETMRAKFNELALALRR